MKRLLVAAAAVAAIGAGTLVLMSEERPAEQPAAAAQVLPVNAAQARQLMAKGALLADVREPKELAETGKLEGALNVPMNNLRRLAAHGQTPSEISADKQRPIILYCRTGRRSSEAGGILAAHGFRQIYILGGFEDAVKAGMPTA